MPSFCIRSVDGGASFGVAAFGLRVRLGVLRLRLVELLETLRFLARFMRNLSGRDVLKRNNITLSLTTMKAMVQAFPSHSPMSCLVKF
jgi:hypothetical protein